MNSSQSQSGPQEVVEEEEDTLHHKGNPDNLVAGEKARIPAVGARTPVVGAAAARTPVVVVAVARTRVVDMLLVALNYYCIIVSYLAW